MSAPLSNQKNSQADNTRPRFEVADILREYLPDYLRDHRLSPQQFKIVKSIVACRTAVLGGHVWECNNGDCGHEDQSYNSCGDRHCPKCQGVAKNKWLKKRLKELLPTHYFHVVFTLPHLLNDLALYNKTLFYDILFEASSKTLKEISGNPQYLGAKMGLLGILHTWGQTMVNHLHIHYIVPGGGVATDKDGREHWVELPKKDKFLFPKKVLTNLFRGKFIGLLKKAYREGRLKLPDSQAELSDPRLFELFIDQVVNRRWNVFTKTPFASPAEVLLYIGRYTHRVAISNHRILSIDHGKVSFTYKDYKDDAKQKIMRLPATEFIRRFLLHILPKGYHKIHMYGFWANSCRAKNIEKVRRLILKSHSVIDFSDELVEKMVQSLSEHKLNSCPKCGKGVLIKKVGIAPSGRVYIEAADSS
jgi:hypothetical protein